MIAQPLFDTLADALVERGEPVTYTSIQRSLKAVQGKGASDRDLQGPYADWRRRRRHKPHLASLDLPDAMEQAIADFAARAMRAGAARAADAKLPRSDAADMLLDRIGNLEEEVACLARENRALRAEITAVHAGPVAPPIGERKRGTSAAISRFFWGRIMRGFARKIRVEGPQSFDQLLASIGDEDRTLALKAFRPIDARTLRKALAERTSRGRHGLTDLGDGRYGIVRVRRRARARSSDGAAR